MSVFLQTILEGVSFSMFWVAVLDVGLLLQEMVFYLHDRRTHRKRGRR